MLAAQKTAIHETVIALDMEDCFVGGHPMAGSERTGYACSKASLWKMHIMYHAHFKNNERSARHNDSICRQLFHLYLTIKIMTHAVAAISHVPHVIASSLVNLVAQSDFPDGTMKKLLQAVLRTSQELHLPLLLCGSKFFYK